MSNIIERMNEEKFHLVRNASISKEEKNIAIARHQNAIDSVQASLSAILRFEEGVEYVINEQSLSAMNSQLVKYGMQDHHLDKGKNHIICRNGVKLFVDNKEVIDLNNKESVLSFPVICLADSSIPLINICIFLDFFSALE